MRKETFPLFMNFFSVTTERPTLLFFQGHFTHVTHLHKTILLKLIEKYESYPLK